MVLRCHACAVPGWTLSQTTYVQSWGWPRWSRPPSPACNVSKARKKGVCGPAWLSPSDSGRRPSCSPPADSPIPTKPPRAFFWTASTSCTTCGGASPFRPAPNWPPNDAPASIRATSPGPDGSCLLQASSFISSSSHKSSCPRRMTPGFHPSSSTSPSISTSRAAASRMTWLRA